MRDKCVCVFMCSVVLRMPLNGSAHFNAQINGHPLEYFCRNLKNYRKKSCANDDCPLNEQMLCNLSEQYSKSWLDFICNLKFISHFWLDKHTHDGITALLSTVYHNSIETLNCTTFYFISLENTQKINDPIRSMTRDT